MSRAPKLTETEIANAERFEKAVPGTWVVLYDEGSTAERTRVWKSSIVGGDALIVGGSYILQRTPAKAPESFKLGGAYRALGDSEGNFTGEVIDFAHRTFVVDHNDLFTTY